MAVVFVLAALASCALAAMPSFPLHNAAGAGMSYPAVGLGTGGYGLDPNLKYPECWIDQIPGCGIHAQNATKTWLQLGGRRIDSADSYYNQPSVGKGIVASGVARSEIFITSKVGPTNPLGYNDTLQQMDTIKQRLGVDYVDLLLIHWPTYSPSALSPTQSQDPLCNHTSRLFNETKCRISTWKAMLKLFQDGSARAIGVANYNITHLQELIIEGLPLPAVNQCPFSVHISSAQQALRDFCAAHNIVFNGYSPLGVPDTSVDVPATASLLRHKFPTPMTANVLDEPAIMAIAAAHSRTPAEIVLAWQYQLGVATNPRTMDPAHMLQNMNLFDITLTAAEMQTMNSFPQDYCDQDNWYECVPRNGQGFSS